MNRIWKVCACMHGKMCAPPSWMAIIGARSQPYRYRKSISDERVILLHPENRDQINQIHTIARDFSFNPNKQIKDSSATYWCAQNNPIKSLFWWLSLSNYYSYIGIVCKISLTKNQDNCFLLNLSIMDKFMITNVQGRCLKNIKE